MRTFIKTTIILTLFVLSLARLAMAADLFLESPAKSQVVPNQDFLVEVFANTENRPINALSGKMTFPKELLEVREIRDGNSRINLWIERPTGDIEGEIVFSGITPGGFFGKQEFIFSVVFHAKQDGSGKISLTEIQALQNNKETSPISLKTFPLEFSISQKNMSSEVFAIEDKEPPEYFRSTIGNDPSLFENKRFLVFATADKGIGISHYEVREGLWSKYATATSPYILKNGLLSFGVHIKAIDKNGNERVSFINPKKPMEIFSQYLILAIIVLAFLFLLKKCLKHIISF